MNFDLDTILGNTFEDVALQFQKEDQFHKWTRKPENSIEKLHSWRP